MEMIKNEQIQYNYFTCKYITLGAFVTRHCIVNKPSVNAGSNIV